MNVITMPAPQVSVRTTSFRGLTPEEHAERCADRIISIADTLPPEIRDQAREFRAQIVATVARGMHAAIASDRTTIQQLLTDAGHPQLGALIRGT